MPDTGIQKGRALKRALFFIGWLLSPLTFWNDAFVNIPLSYGAAFLITRRTGSELILPFIVAYWLSNVFGVVLMYATGRKLFSNPHRRAGEIVRLVLTVIVYTAVIILLWRAGLIK